MKSINELINEENSAWNLIDKWISISEVDVVIIKPVKNYAENSLYKLQVSTKSLLGIIAYKTGGILINNSWLRIYGSGNKEVRSIDAWNEMDDAGVSNKYKGALLVADDVVGGTFAINAGAFEGKQGNVHYLAPDTLEWEDLELTYSQFVQWSITGDTDSFYESFRWENWQKDVKNIDISHGMLIYPFLWADESDINDRTKKIVPIDELWGLTIENMSKLG